MRHFILLCLLVGLVLPGIPHSTAQDSDSRAPYLYYFSEAERGIVIERADGTDRHIIEIGHLIKFEDYAFISENVEYDPVTAFTAREAGWSYSGEWFAWELIRLDRNFYYYGSAYSELRPFVQNVRTGERLEFMDQYSRADMQWSPTADILLIAAYESSFSPDSSNASPTKLMLVNMRPIPAVVASIEFSEDIRFRLSWTEDGQRAIAMLSGDQNQGEDVFFIFERNGDFRIRSFRNVVSWNGINQLNSFTGEHIIYHEDNQLILHNLITDKQLEIPDVEVEDDLSVYWSSDRRSALVGLKYIVSYVGDIVEVKTIPDDTFEGVSFWDLNNGNQWSPDGRFLMWRVDAGVYALDMRDASANRLPLENIYSNFVHWDWISNSEAVVSSEDRFIKYDALTNEAEVTLTDIPGQHWGCLPFQFQAFDEGRSIVYLAQGPNIFDTESGELQEFRPNANDHELSDFGGDIFPDTSEQDWLLLFPDAFVAGGCGLVTYFKGIMKRDGTYLRDLPLEEYHFLVNWLPENVNLNSLPELPPATQPAEIIQTNSRISWLDWHSDGEKFLVSKQSYFYEERGNVEVWDIETGDSQVALEDVDPSLRPYWDGNEVEVYEYDYGDFVAVSPDGRAGVRQARSGPQVVNIARDEVIVELDLDHHVIIQGDFSPDGSYFAVGIHFDKSKIFDTKTWEVVATLPHPSPAITFSPDGTQIAVAAAWDIEIWDLADLIEAEEEK